MKPTAGVEHSWLTMSNDGKLAFLGDSSVYDVKTHKEIAVMKDEFGRRIVHTEKVLYLGFKNGKLVEGNNQFAIGDAKAYAARMAGGKTNIYADVCGKSTIPQSPAPTRGVGLCAGGDAGWRLK